MQVCKYILYLELVSHIFTCNVIFLTIYVSTIQVTYDGPSMNTNTIIGVGTGREGVGRRVGQHSLRLALRLHTHWLSDLVVSSQPSHLLILTQLACLLLRFCLSRPC